MANTEDILSALSKLDPSKDEHWTKDGLPYIPTLRELAGDEKLTRAMVEAASPGFRRPAPPPAAPAIEAPAIDAPAEDPRAADRAVFLATSKILAENDGKIPANAFQELAVDLTPGKLEAIYLALVESMDKVRFGEVEAARAATAPAPAPVELGTAPCAECGLVPGAPIRPEGASVLESEDASNEVARQRVELRKLRVELANTQQVLAKIRAASGRAVRAPIDQALAARNGAPGAGRPKYPPVKGA